jgi:hypothetical protein
LIIMGQIVIIYLFNYLLIHLQKEFLVGQTENLYSVHPLSSWHTHAISWDCKQVAGHVYLI